VVTKRKEVSTKLSGSNYNFSDELSVFVTEEDLAEITRQVHKDAMFCLRKLRDEFFFRNLT
jgi:hypothetical protein